MWELVGSGGILAWIIMAAAVMATWIFFLKLLHFNRASIDLNDFMTGIVTVLKEQTIPEAITISNETPGPASHVVRVALLNSDKSREEMYQAVEIAALSELPRLERMMPFLATIAHLTPLLGLMGTILGMMDAYAAMMENAPMIHAGNLAEGIWKALITSALGLGVAIPTYAAYNLLVTRMTTILRDMEQATAQILDILHRRQKALQGGGHE
jgi:biopolymer transport protein ExbB